MVGRFNDVNASVLCLEKNRVLFDVYCSTSQIRLTNDKCDKYEIV